MTILIAFAIFLAICSAVLFVLAWRAPLGYEDSEGFHLGEEDG